MTHWMLAFSVGVIILHCTGIVLPWNVEVLLLVSFFAILAWLIAPARFFIIAVFCSLGYFYAAFSIHLIQSLWLPEKAVGKELQLEGYACSLPERKEHYFSLEFCATNVSAEKKADMEFTRPEHLLRFRLSGPKHLVDQFKQGNVRLTARFKAPRASVNFVGSSYEKYLFAKEVVGRLWLLSVDPLSSKGVEDTALSLTAFQRLESKLNLYRWELDSVIRSVVSEFEHAGILRALAIGERSDISVDDNQILQATGLQHLMAISGLHVGMLIWLLLTILPNRTGALVAICVVGFLYICLVGFSASAQRAWVMGIVGLLMLKGYLPVKPWSALIIALSFVLVMDPLAPMRLGFWYSFGAIVLIGLAARFHWLDAAKPLQSLLLIQGLFLVFGVVMNSIFALPQGLSMWLANLLAIPLVSWVTLPLVIVGSALAMFLNTFSMDWELFTSLIRSCFLLANETVHFLLVFADAMNQTNIGLRTAFDVAGLLALLALFYCVLALRLRNVLSGLAMLSICLYLILPININDEAPPEMLVFDSGQGLSLMLMHQHEAWVYDLGPAFENFSVAERVVMPYLRAHDLESSVHGLVLSHGDADHVGRASFFVDEVKPKFLISGEPERVDDGFKLCRAGQHYQIGDALIEVLYSADSQFRDIRPTKTSANNRSCVMRFSYQGHSVLLMGDLEGRGEQHFLNAYKEDLSSDILILGHHGSANASSYALLKRIRPKWAVASAGYGNSFGHPGEQVIDRLISLDIDLLNTADSGAIRFVFESNEIKIQEARLVKKAFWMWPAER